MSGLIWNPGDTGPEDERECKDDCASWEGDECNCAPDEPDGPDGCADDWPGKGRVRAELRGVSVLNLREVDRD